MSTRRMLAITHASSRFEAVRDLLIVALDRHDSRSCLDAFVELAGLHLEQTGGTLISARYRQELAVLAARVALEPVLRALPDLAPTAPTHQELPPMAIEIDSNQTYWPTRIAWQARAEFKRQAGWVETNTDKGIWLAPFVTRACDRCGKSGGALVLVVPDGEGADWGECDETCPGNGSLLNCPCGASEERACDYRVCAEGCSSTRGEAAQ